MGMPEENIKSLFDADRSASDQLRAMREFLEHRTTELRNAGTPARDLIVHYVGHGLFSGSENDYCLAVRATEEQSEGFTSIRMRDLAAVIRQYAAFMRKYLILDCCFSGAAYEQFQSGPLSVMQVKVRDVLDDESPQRGTCLLCSASAKDPSVAPKGLPRTMFSDSLLTILTEGHELFGPWMSFTELGDLVRIRIKETYRDLGVRPEVHSPDQGSGDVARVPLFPNPASTKSAAKEEDEQRLAQERLEAESQAKAREEAERVAREKEEEQRLAQERLEAESQAKAREEAERVAREKEEEQRLAQERLEAESQAKAREEVERVAREKEEEQRLAQERIEAESQAKAREEAERVAREKEEEQRFAQERLEAESQAKAREEVERVAREKEEEAERVSREREEAERAKQLAREREAAERTEREWREWRKTEQQRQKAEIVSSSQDITQTTTARNAARVPVPVRPVAAEEYRSKPSKWKTWTIVTAFLVAVIGFPLWLAIQSISSSISERNAKNPSDPSKMVSLGTEYYNHGDNADALNWYRKAAEAGNSDGMVSVGFMYQNGHGVSEDYFQAASWYQKAADTGNAAGLRSLGQLYLDGGNGFPRDPDKARILLQKAADLGDIGAKGLLK